MTELSSQDISAIAQQTAALILEALFTRNRDEISTADICREYGISAETVRRKVRAGLLPAPSRKRGRNWFTRTDIVEADLQGRL